MNMLMPYQIRRTEIVAANRMMHTTRTKHRRAPPYPQAPNIERDKREQSENHRSPQKYINADDEKIIENQYSKYRKHEHRKFR